MPSAHFDDLIPFYVAQTLSPQEAFALERHLATCEPCRRAVEDWRKIASAVRAEAASQMRELPPLSPALLAQIRTNPQSVESFREETVYMPPVRRSRSSSGTVMRQIAIPLTLAAAAAMVLVFGALLLMLSQRPPEQLGAANTANPEATATPTVDVLATIAARSTLDRAASTTPQPERTSIALTFATNTPSLPPPTATTPIPVTPTRDPLLPPAAIVSGENINLRGGPSTDYPIVGTAQRDERLTILARAGSGSNLWLQIEDSRGEIAWVYSGIVVIDPVDAVIPAASTIPTLPPTQTPEPTFTPTLTPTASGAIRSGNWVNVATIVEHQCGGEIGFSTSMETIVVPSPDLTSVTITYRSNGISFTVFRTFGTNYSGSYSLPEPDLGGSAAVSVQITFDVNGVTYTGQETVVHADGCLVRSVWAGRAME